MSLSRNLARIERAFGPAFVVLGAVIVILTFPFILMAIGAIELWAGIKAQFPGDKMNVPSGDGQ